MGDMDETEMTRPPSDSGGERESVETEQYGVGEGAPESREEEARQERRKQRNRASAKASRERKCEMFRKVMEANHELTEKIRALEWQRDELTRANEAYRVETEALRTENDALRQYWPAPPYYPPYYSSGAPQTQKGDAHFSQLRPLSAGPSTVPAVLPNTIYTRGPTYPTPY